MLSYHALYLLLRLIDTYLQGLAEKIPNGSLLYLTGAPMNH